MQSKTVEQRKLLIFDSFLNLTMDGIAVVDLDGTVLEINRKFEELHGWSREEVIGKVLPMTPESCKKDAYALYQRIRNGEQIANLEMPKLRKDGSLFYADVTISPIKDEEGMVIGFVGVERDISERRQAALALQESEERFQRMLRLSPEPIVLHANGSIVFVNDMGVRLFAANSADELLGRSIFDLFCQKDHPIIQERIRQVVQSDTYMDFIELRLLRLDGIVLDVEVASICVHREVGSPVIQIVIRDMTERKKTEELLRKSEKLSIIGQLAAGVAHEIRNPLTAIKGFAQLLKSQHTQYIDYMLEELERIEHIVNEFMNLAKPQDMLVKKTDIPALVQNVVFFMQPQALLSGVQVVFREDEPVKGVYCDSNQIKQVMINVLKNAIEAMPKGGIVEVTVTAGPDDGVRVRILDQGVGIPEDQLPKLGDPFFSMKTNGTGLGLTVCHRIIGAHRGKMTIESEVNVGTAVVIELPEGKGS